MAYPVSGEKMMMCAVSGCFSFFLPCWKEVEGSGFIEESWGVERAFRRDIWEACVILACHFPFFFFVFLVFPCLDPRLNGLARLMNNSSLRPCT